MNHSYGIITLACIEAGEGLDSDLLDRMLEFRDGFLCNSFTGVELVKAYNQVLKRLIDALDRAENRHKLLMDMYSVIKEMDGLISENKFEEATGVYISAVLKLEKSIKEKM